MRIAAGIEYDGTAYNGWQRVAAGHGVQEVVEDAFGTVADATIETVCAGRTDTGVHATGQVVHFDTGSIRDERAWLLGSNSNLPGDVSVAWVRPVVDAFHARYAATARTYRYLILNAAVRSALVRNRAWWVHAPLDQSRMAAAARHLVGEYDFSAFRAAGCQSRTPVREIHSLEVARFGDWVAITVTANAFLQHMVRNIVGLLAEVGRGDAEPERVAAVLESRDRREAGIAAPARGLTLVSVAYPEEWELPVPPVPRLMPGVE